MKTQIAMIAATSAGLLLADCAMSKQTYLPDGRLGHSISCDGAAVGMNYCFEKAGELCQGRGYDLVSREGQIIPYGIASGTASVDSFGGGRTHGLAHYGALNTKLQ